MPGGKRGVYPARRFPGGGGPKLIGRTAAINAAMAEVYRLVDGPK